MIALVCPECKVNLKVGDDRAGETIKCPKCDASIRVPLSAPPTRPPAPPPARAASRGEDEDESRRRGRVLPEGREVPSRREVDEEEPRRAGGTRRFRCVRCGSTATPQVMRRVSKAGWIVFVLLAVFTCFIFSWIGLFMREDYRVCPDCGAEQP